MTVSSRWQDADVARCDDYDARWGELSAAGENIHGEADLVQALLAPTGGHRVLDAGCGTGRIAIELARRGISVIGVDSDPEMLTAARAKAPELAWAHCDLAVTGDLIAAAPGPFDLVLLAGNVMIFLEPGTEHDVLANLVGRLAPDGLLVAGFSLHADLTLEQYDGLARREGLSLVHRWATWDREPFTGGDYAVSAHRR
jgi:2-polyprenyl-3-methyl-5-hydroxy-6-metoxy-1,4-benzoquinol methylase